MRWITVALLLLIGCAVLHQVECCTKGWLAFENQCILIARRPLLVYWGAVMQCYARNSLVVAVSSESMRKFLEIHTSSDSPKKFWVNLESEEPTGLLPSMPEECHYFEDGVVKTIDCDERYFFAAKICSRPKPTHDPIENCLQSSTQHSFIGEWTGRCVFRTPAASAYEDARSNCAGHGGRFLTLPEVIQDGLNDYNKHHVMMNDGLKYWTDLKTNGTSIDPIWDLYIQRNATNFVRGTGECVTVSYRFNNTQNVILLHQTECNDHAYAMCSTEYSGTTLATTLHAYSTTMHQPYSTQATTNEHYSTRVTADQPHSSQSTTHQPDSRQSTTQQPVSPMVTSQQSDSPLHRTTQGEATGSCPIGHNWKVYKGNCFWETSFETSRMSWDDARIHCQAYGGDLASFHSKEEEMIGLSFQYGSHPHPYWTGLRLNRDTETYIWSDDSPLDYQNWAPGHPNHKDKQLECVSFDAQAKHWISTLCGMLSWFVCKVPKRINAPIPVIPKVTPVPRCDETTPNQFYFEDYCYSFVGTPHTWHRAEEYCENQGSKLVSIHSVEEIGFLLRIVYDAKSAIGNRIWIGLNSLRNGVLRWTDHSPVDFTFWNENEPNNMGNTEKCCSMLRRNC
ncbi:hypothetical protein JTE90_002860 [Oedothorax gibbosus]|uniref:C-type lectin domain-containing protein n=1 Tax=Oedothorax gibbosus TaxID=931172 RepID=A0AAV6TVF0_9ARAC|nr:hypothetical protein JTE90_002860 [Oedothorax gibbosus]